MLFTVEFMLMFSLSIIHLAHAQGCPNMCTCTGTTVNCFNKGLTQIPDNIPSTTTALYLLRNSITTIEEHVFKGLTSLHTLILSENGITSLEKNVFEELTSLQTLYVSGNSITSIEENVFEKLTSLQDLRITNNPLVCCLVTGFVDWINGRSWGTFSGTCTAHNKTTSMINFNTSDCIVPVDGGWSDWETSTCSVTCGDGTVTMNRTCNNPVPSGDGKNCSGESTDTDSCYLGLCPESCRKKEKRQKRKGKKPNRNGRY